MQQKLLQHRLANGLVILGERMPWLESAAFTMMLPGGTCREPAGREGLAGLTLELSQRGAGALSSREIVERLDFLGVERSSHVSSFHTTMSMASMASVLEPTLEVAASILQSPHFPESELEEARQSALLELASIDDDPAQKCFKELKQLRFGDVFGRSALGSLEGLESVELDECVRFHADFCRPGGAVLALAGNFDWDRLLSAIESLFGAWSGSPSPEPGPVVSKPGVSHLQHDSQQTHIALAYDSVPYCDPEYYRGRGIVSILSDGMSSRLFTEVREKRGLVYAVSASSHSLKNCGSVLCYAGTTSNRAQETLEVTVDTIRAVSQGIDPDELSRLKSRVQTSLVMEQESSAARSSQIAYDWMTLGRVPSRQEVLQEIHALTCESLVQHFHSHPPRGWTLVTIGPEALEFSHAVSP
ncbi:MAG: insulinase family protein [Pirellula sp.]|jgi:predicted Zn-dependent peptidase|nr:insulinase family protein [Pirellula sp.]